MAKQQKLSKKQIRAHALDLAIALHRDSIRIRLGVRENEPEVDAGKLVLADALRFAEFINSGDVIDVALDAVAHRYAQAQACAAGLNAAAPVGEQESGQ